MSRANTPLLTLTVVAAGVIAAYRGVGFDDLQATVAGQKIKGFAKTAAALGATVAVESKGTTIAETGGAFAVGAALAIDATGRVVAAAALAVANPTVNAGAVAVTSTAANGAIVTQGAISGGYLPQYVFADALQAAAGAGEFVEILMR